MDKEDFRRHSRCTAIPPPLTSWAESGSYIVPKRIPASLCVKCKGYKRLCGLASCPILDRFRAQVSSVTRLGSRPLELQGSTPPSLVVGEQGYPKVPILFNIPPQIHGEKARTYDSPLLWWTQRYSLKRIIELRSYLVSSILKSNVKDPWKLYEKELSIAAVSTKPTDSEARLQKPPIPHLSFDGILAPHGPRAPASNIRIVSNPKPPQILEKLIWDDVKASEAVWLLYKEKVDFYTIVRAFSLGLLGVKRNRRLVPTRWAITAVDSAIAAKLLEAIKSENKVIDHIEVYNASYLGNKFTIILFPGPYRLEMVEIWHPLTIWTHNTRKPILHWVREDKPNQFTEQDGGMMAARLSVLEHLARRGRQATVFIIREITPDYYAPVGNWHIRLTTAHALAQPMLRSNDPKEVIELLNIILKNERLLNTIIGKSRIFDRLYTQKKLDHYLQTRCFRPINRNTSTTNPSMEN